MKGVYKMPGSRYWWFRWSQAGKRYAVSLKTDDESVAITKARQLLAGKSHGAAGRVLDINTAISQYLGVIQERGKRPVRPHTSKRTGYILRQYAAYGPIKYVADVTHKSIQDWLTRGKACGWSADTVHTYARCLRTFVNHLVDNNLAGRESFRDFEVPQRLAAGRKNWVEHGECLRVIREAEDPSLRFILLAGFHAGLRRGEICSARVHWFDVGRGLVHVQNDVAAGFILKDRENRTIPLTSEFKNFLENFLAGRGRDEFVLKPDNVGGSLVSYRYDFRRIFYRHMRRCGVKCSIHDMRRSFASNLVSNGESIYIVAKWLGDGVEVVERSYGHLGPAAGNINRLVESGKPHGKSGESRCRTPRQRSRNN